jgi:iron-sulfur cluster assembly protein
MAYSDKVIDHYENLRNGLNEGFDFLNPNERNQCGCGESFRV